MTVRFDDQFLTELKARNDIMDVIGQYVTLKRAGSRYNGLCPFHSEKTPSFTVFPDTASYYCFGCGAGGDVITFIMNTEHLEYVDAVSLLAQKSGMNLPEDGGGDETMKKRARQLEMHKLAARRFFEHLKDPNTPQGIQYFIGRGLTPNTITRFGLGFAPESFTDLRDFLRQNGFRDEEAYEAGLLIRSQKNGKYYDKFRNRVMFPVIDVRGNVVAFSGRVLDDSKPKYMNSPETLLYKKSQTVFGLNFAKQNTEERIILVEGNLDVATLHQAGFDGAVAPLGTAFTKEQARMLSKYAKTVVVAFDMDKAGIKATDKAISYLEELGVTVRVLQMNGAKDPDEYIKKHGKERFAMLLEGSKNPTQYALDKLAAQYDLSDVTGKTEYIRKAVKVVASVASDIERDLFCTILGKQTDVAVETVRKEVARERDRFVRNTKAHIIEQETAGAHPLVDRVNPERVQNMRAAKAEEGIIAVLSHSPDLADSVQKQVPHFLTSFNQKVYSFFLDKIAEGVSPENILTAHFSPPEVAKIMQIINTHLFGEQLGDQLEDYIRILNEELQKKHDPGTQTPEQIKKMLQQKGVK